MLKLVQAPKQVQLQETFLIEGTASSNLVGKNLVLTVDSRFQFPGSVVKPDGTWRISFRFLQAGGRRIEVSGGGESINFDIQVLPVASQPVNSLRLSFTNLPQTTLAEETFNLGGEAKDYADGAELVLMVDGKYEIARPKVLGGKWQVPVFFHQAGRRVVELIGSEQDRSQITLEIKPPKLNVTIVPRSIWTSIATPLKIPLLQPKRITLHHTYMHPNLPANATQDRECTRMREIWSEHVEGNGWDDIGYHYVIMPSGRIFEGRSELRRGAHDVINDGLGIAFDGDYTSTRITEAQFQSAVTLCAKLCQRYGINNPLTPVPTPTESYGIRALPRILGHRDRVATACPGSEGGRTVRLEEIRQAVAKVLNG